MAINNEQHTEVIPEVIFLGQLIERIVSGRMRVPHFQRSFAWSQRDVLDLLDSVFNGFPIGSILLWETDPENIISSNYVGPIKVKDPKNSHVDFLLDGQQRVSTLFGILMLPNGSPSTVDQIDWRVYFDLEKSKFTRAPRGGVTPRYFPMAALLTTSGFLDVTRKIDKINNLQQREDWLSATEHLSNSFRNYQIPLIRIRTPNIDTAVRFFSKLNRKRSSITTDEMVSALTFRPEKFHLADKLDQYMNQLSRKGFGNLNRIILIKAILVALGHDIYAKDWASIMVDDETRNELPEKFELATTGINRALIWLKGLGVISDRLLPYGLQLVFLGEFYRQCPDPTNKILRAIKRWFWVTSFTGWFGLASTSKITHAFNEMIKIARGEIDQFSVINLDEPALPFPSCFDGRSARAKTFLLYLSSLGPLSLKGGEKLNVGDLLSNYGINSISYISYKLAKSKEFKSIPANYMFIDADLTGDAFDHLRGLNDELLIKILPSHGFSVESIDTLRKGDVRRLIHDRQEYLIDGERLFMKRLQVQIPEKPTYDTVADSDTSNFEE